MTDDYMSAFDQAADTNLETNPSISGLLEQAEQLISLENQIADLEQLLKALTSKATSLKTQIIPDKMAELGLNSFSTPSGNKLRVEDFVSGSLPKDPWKRDRAIKALEQWGAGGLIRNEISMLFGVRQHNEALDLAENLRGQGFDCEVKHGVHPQTYLSIIRERLAEGQHVDADEMGVFIGRKTKVTMAQKKGSNDDT